MTAVDREKRWRDALDAVRSRLDGLEFIDGDDDVAVLREQVIRTRLAASAERQAHEARAVVFDAEELPGGGLRFVIAVPTGDRRELREQMVLALAAVRMANDDVDAMRGVAGVLRAQLAQLREAAQRVVDAQYPGSDNPAPFPLQPAVAILSGVLADLPEVP